MEIKIDVIKINNIEIKVLDLVWFIMIPIINVNYILASLLAKNGHDLTIALDKIIPFKSIFIIPYVYWYIYIIIGFLFILMNSRIDYMRLFISFLIGMCVCYAVYYIYPTEITRPIISNSNILNNLVNGIYLADKPVNCFPSLHVLTTYFIMRYTKYENSRKKFYYTQVIGILIILSTLFIKQHFVVDVIGGILLGEITILLVKKIDDYKIEKILNLPYIIKDIFLIKFKKNNDIKSKDIIKGEKELIKNKK
ncbi:phosphatase PAP2 family protein [Clostridium sp. D53t1_180928_C8]|uniref:phosphatase PAP2 family protein n=1 Tax=Clostridium sp. D53t1_180928_C8 TaxID=2787101 RepID=UPI00325FC681